MDFQCIMRCHLACGNAAHREISEHLRGTVALSALAAGVAAWRADPLRAGNATLSALASLAAPMGALPGAKDQAVVVLGGGVWRAARAAEIQRTSHMRIYLAGADLAPALASHGGIATWEDAISIDIESNAALAACVLQPNGVHRVALVTDCWHMARAAFWFRVYGFHVSEVTAPIPRNVSDSEIVQRAKHELGGLAEAALHALMWRLYPCPVFGTAPDSIGKGIWGEKNHE